MGYLGDGLFRMGYFAEGLFWRRDILGMGYLGWVI